MCDTIQELDEKNDVAHNKLNKSILSLKSNIKILENNLNNYHVKSTILIDKTVSKIDTALEKMEAATSNLKASSTTTNLYKGLVTILITIIAGSSLLSLKSKNEATEARIETLKQLEEIRNEIRNNIDYAKTVDIVTLMDTINSQWEQQVTFYNNEFKPLMLWTHKVWKNEINPNTKYRLKDELLSKDIDIRLKRLEKDTIYNK